MTEALGIHELWLFILSGLLLNITPGPDTAYILGRSIQLGWHGGAAAAIGICCGCLVHVFGAAIGLSALLMASSAAFAAVKLVGAAYLLFTGIQMLLSRPRPVAEATVPGDGISLRAVFWQGFLTNALNPKVALFFLAFLPQFINLDAPMKPLAFLVLGAIFTFTATWWNLFVAWSAAKMSAAMGSRWVDWGQRAIGAFFVGLGVKLAGEAA